MTKTNRHFGRDEIIIGNVYEMKDIYAEGCHRRREHSTVRVRCVEVDSSGVLRIGVSFAGPDTDYALDDLGFVVDTCCYCFPSMLRAVQKLRGAAHPRPTVTPEKLVRGNIPS